MTAHSSLKNRVEQDSQSIHKFLEMTSWVFQELLVMSAGPAWTLAGDIITEEDTETCMLACNQAKEQEVSYCTLKMAVIKKEKKIQMSMRKQSM